jgi:hypothetical protein
MKNLLIAMIALAATSAAADTIYFDDGTVYELKPNESVYVSSGRLWEFTRFLANDLRVQSVEPFAAPAEQCIDQLGFGPEQCTSSDDAAADDDVVETVNVDCSDGFTFGGGC